MAKLTSPKKIKIIIKALSTKKPSKSNQITNIILKNTSIFTTLCLPKTSIFFTNLKTKLHINRIESSMASMNQFTNKVIRISLAYVVTGH